MSRPRALTVATPSDREIVLSREFDAPRSLVFEAMSKPELLKRWLAGPPGWSMVECHSDLRVGGEFRHVWQDTEGNALAMHGVYREVAAPERIVRTEVFEVAGAPHPYEQLATLVLSERNERTCLTITLLYPCKEARDGSINSGMERGAAASYDRLDDLLSGSTGSEA